MNLVPRIAQILGVEIGEEFKVKNSGGMVYDCLFRFTETDMQFKDPKDGWQPTFVINDVIQGKCEVIPLPFTPHEGDDYYFVVWGDEEGLTTDVREFLGSVGNFEDVYCGNCFRTETAAEMHKFEIYKRLTGSDWVEPEQEETNE